MLPNKPHGVPGVMTGVFGIFRSGRVEVAFGPGHERIRRSAVQMIDTSIVRLLSDAELPAKVSTGRRAHDDKSSSKFLASFRSRVSNPSVNQP